MAKITADTLIMECLQLNPNSAQILMSYGMHCLGCAMGHGETGEQACAAHGVDVDAFVAKANDLIRDFAS